MRSVEEFSGRMGLDAEKVRSISVPPSPEREFPWPVHAFLILGTWLGIGFFVLTGILLLAMSGIARSGYVSAIWLVVGLAIAGTGLRQMRRAELGPVEEQALACIACSGVLLSALMPALTYQRSDLAALIAVLLAVGMIRFGRNATTQGFCTIIALCFLWVALSDAEIAFHSFWLALPLPVACLVLMRPARLDLRPMAGVLLLSTPVALVLADPGLGLAEPQVADWGPWLARLMGMVTTCCILWTGVRPARSRAILLSAAVLLGIVLPPAGSAGLAILALAFVLGSRLLALGGIIVTGYVLTAFYYDLDTTLLVKSGMLVLAGCVLTGAWFLLGRKDAAP